MNIVQELLSELSALGKKAEAWGKSEAIKIEAELAPLAKEILTNGVRLAEDVGIQIVEKAAANFASGKSGKDVLNGIEADVRIALPVLASDEGAVALHGVVAALAAKAKQQNAANPVNGTND